jgi:uncharacterized protein YdeI (BOF family)
MKKLLVLALMVVLASPAFAAIQNVKVSGDITSSYLDRSDFGLGALNGIYNTSDVLIGRTTPAGLNQQNVFMTQTRVRIDADLSDNVSATVRLINERGWGQAPTVNNNQNDGVDLDLAYVTLREFLYSPLTVTIGRQEIIMGNGLIIGGGPNEVTSGQFAGVAQDLSLIDSEDGIKAVLDYKPLTLTMFYYEEGQTPASYQGLYGSDSSRSDTYGLNANYQLGDAMNTVVEGYLFSRINGSNYDGTDKGDTLYVPGLRASTNPVKGLNVQGELAWQLGNHPVATQTAAQALAGTHTEEAEHRDAMAAQLLASYSLPVLEKYKPAVNASFTYVSGDKNGDTNYSTDAVKSAKVDTAWDQFDKSQNGGTIYNAIFPLTDMYIYSVGASMAPLEDVSVAASWSDLIAATKFTSTNPLYLLQPNSTYVVPVASGKKNATGLGNEYDVNIGYAYTEDVTFGVSLGWFLSGSAFAAENRGTASQAMADVKVAF